MLFELSIAAQIAGAIILLLWSLGKVSRNAIEMCFPSIAAVDTDEDGNGILKKEILQKNVEKIFLNVWAFFCIICGYIMSLFASNDMENLFFKAIMVVLITILLIIIGYVCARYMSKSWFKNDVKLSHEEMEKMNVLSPILEKEIIDMFK
ncbi:MAG: hypothetical protein IJY97_02640 [Clostridia bacterium]|nr:hypothetical protein [Clostridia bacterium]